MAIFYDERGAIMECSSSEWQIAQEYLESTIEEDDSDYLYDQQKDNEREEMLK